MGPRGFTACVLFCVVIAFSLLAVGRTVLRARQFARPLPQFAENSWKLRGLGSDASAASLPRPPDPDTYRRASGPLAAKFSLPITFESAGASARHTVQCVGRGEGMTVLLESDGIEIAVPKRAGGTATPSTVKLRLVHGAGASVASATSIGATYGIPTGLPARRKKRRSSKSASHSHRRGTRKARPHRDTPGHKAQAPRAQRPPQQRLPRQTKPTGQLEIPQGNQGTREANFVWQGVAPVGSETNYFLGNDRAKWRTHVQHFAKASATNVLPGVDIVAYGNSEGFEYDLRVGPGVDPRDLHLEIAADGAARSENIRLDASGDLLITLDGQELRMKKPAIYEEWAAAASQPIKRKQIVGGYELAADGSVAFHLGPHDPGATLVLDPSLSVAYTTFLGGAGNEIAESIALDSSGNVYIGGTTTSAATFTEGGNTKQAGTGTSDFFMAKINPSLSGPSSLVYLTFIGGSGAQAGGKIAVDSNGNVAIAGTSTSADYPTTDGSALTAGANGTAVNDAAVTEIDPTGAKLVYSTLFGGNGNEGSLSSGGIAMDSAGDIFIAMDTASTNLPVAPTAAPGPYSSVYGGGASDGFLAVFQPVVSGTMPHVKYCTYLGIDAIATVTSVAVDSVGNAYLAGYTQTDPIGTLRTANGFQTTYGGNGDGFVMKILPSGNGVADLSYGTFLGGGEMDQALAITVGTQLPGTAYVTGTTQSKDFPVTGTNIGNITGYQTALGGSCQRVSGGDRPEQRGRDVTDLFQLFGRRNHGRGAQRVVQAD